jgi:hypothetical protein
MFPVTRRSYTIYWPAPSPNVSNIPLIHMVEEFLAYWKRKTCTFGDALQKYRLCFDIVSITSLEENIPFHSLQPFVSAKRLTGHRGAPCDGRH